MKQMEMIGFFKKSSAAVRLYRGRIPRIKNATETEQLDLCQVQLYVSQVSWRHLPRWAILLELHWHLPILVVLWAGPTERKPTCVLQPKDTCDIFFSIFLILIIDFQDFTDSVMDHRLKLALTWPPPPPPTREKSLSHRTYCLSTYQSMYNLSYLLSTHGDVEKYSNYLPIHLSI